MIAFNFVLHFINDTVVDVYTISFVRNEFTKSYRCVYRDWKSWHGESKWHPDVNPVLHGNISLGTTPLLLQRWLSEAAENNFFQRFLQAAVSVSICTEAALEELSQFDRMIENKTVRRRNSKSYKKLNCACTSKGQECHWLTWIVHHSTLIRAKSHFEKHKNPNQSKSNLFFYTNSTTLAQAAYSLSNHKPQTATGVFLLTFT